MGTEWSLNGILFLTDLIKEVLSLTCIFVCMYVCMFVPDFLAFWLVFSTVFSELGDGFRDITIIKKFETVMKIEGREA